MRKLLFGITLLASMSIFANECVVDLQIGGTIDDSTKSFLVTELEKRGYEPKNYYTLSDQEIKAISKKVRVGASYQQRQIKGGVDLGYRASFAATQIFGRKNPIYSDMSHNLNGDELKTSKDYKFTRKSEQEIYSDIAETILATIPDCN